MLSTNSVLFISATAMMAGNPAGLQAMVHDHEKHIKEVFHDIEEHLKKYDVRRIVVLLTASLFDRPPCWCS